MNCSACSTVRPGFESEPKGTVVDSGYTVRIGDETRMLSAFNYWRCGACGYEHYGPDPDPFVLAKHVMSRPIDNFDLLTQQKARVLAKAVIDAYASPKAGSEA